MWDDKRLVRELKHNRPEALERIYMRYRDDMLALALSLAGNQTVAEDAVHDVFVAFARAGRHLQVRTNLKGYLLTAIANRMRSLARSRQRCARSSDEASLATHQTQGPDERVMATENSEVMEQALACLPADQREVIVLHLQADMTFRQIARSQGVSVHTAHSRYRYGLTKLRTLLNGEVDV
jgi:RNA polymerase sigma-70 factor (ECF subfamily)